MKKISFIFILALLGCHAQSDETRGAGTNVSTKPTAFSQWTEVDLKDGDGRFAVRFDGRYAVVGASGNPRTGEVTADELDLLDHAATQFSPADMTENEICASDDAAKSGEEISVNVMNHTSYTVYRAPATGHNVCQRGGAKSSQLRDVIRAIMAKYR